MYFGSGVIIKDYIKSKGKSELKRTILEFGYTRGEMNTLEAKFVPEELLKHPLNINLDKGGRHKHTRYKKVNKKIGKTMKKIRAERKDDWGSVKGADNNRASEWKLISPNGEVFEIKGTLNLFCKNKGISANTIKKAVVEGWIPKRGSCAGWQAFNLTLGRGTVRDTLNHGEARSGTNNPNHKSKLERMKQ
jgi:hypothetical protein